MFLPKLIHFHSIPANRVIGKLARLCFNNMPHAVSWKPKVYRENAIFWHTPYFKSLKFSIPVKHENKFNQLWKIHNYIFLLLSIITSACPYYLVVPIRICLYSSISLISFLSVFYLFFRCFYSVCSFFQNQCSYKICFYKKCYADAISVQIANKI